ncbi:MAG: hypothetical protein ABW210_11715 [Achromobacter sp.]
MTDSTPETVTLPSTAHRPVLKLLGWVVAAGAIWLSWPFVQPHVPTGIMAKVTAPFYAARLSMGRPGGVARAGGGRVVQADRQYLRRAARQHP